MQFHARVAHLRVERDVGEKHIGSHGVVAEVPAVAQHKAQQCR